jgi:phospholipase/lecithinase/hemolysin
MRKKLLLLSSAVLLLPLSAALALPIDQLVVFGDSLSDTGNAYIGTGGLVGGAPAYQNGRFTDGPNTTPSTSSPTGVWVDQFASKLNLTDPSPFLTGGTNYAVASSVTGSVPGFNSAGAPNTAGQVALYATGNQPSSTTLYVVWAGANDLLTGGDPSTAASNLISNISTLAAGGAKNFLWLNLPQLGDVPAGAANSAALNAESTTFNNAQAAASSQLEAQLGINIIDVDVNSLFAQIIANPAAYGFSNVTDPAQGNTAVDPNTYLFWDDMHPTTAADALVANLAFNDVETAFNPTATPEPATVGLLVSGFLILLLTGIARTLRNKHF